MKNRIFFSLNTVKYLFVIGILASLTLSTTLQSLSLLSENSFEILKVEWQQDSEEEKEDQRENNENKIQPQLFALNHLYIENSTRELNSLSFFFSDSFIEIYTPPPKFGSTFS